MPDQFSLFKRPDPPLGEVFRDQAMDKLSSQHAAWLIRARNVLHTHAMTHGGEVSSDDCWRLCPPPEEAHPSVMGPLFRDNRFVRVGAKQSTRASAHARWISLYIVKDSPL